jgi:hypothetical protein
MIRYKRHNTLWLAALSTMMALVIISGNVSADVQAVLLGVFMVALAGSFIDLSASDQFFQAIQKRSLLSRTRTSPQAREAVARASSRGGGYYQAEIQLIDIGLIAAQTGQDGLVMRRTRSISKDDDGVRPFLTLQVAPTEADRNAHIRFEIVDQNGREQYIHEMKVYLRDGEMNVLADHHLPLMKNDHISGSGDWDLRVYIDGTLVGLHNVMLAPSDEERRHRLGTGGRHYVTASEPEEEEEMPLSLEELLRNQSQSNRS